MRCTPTVLTGLAAVPLLAGLSNAARTINVTAAVALPECVKLCGVQILPQYNCVVGEDCYCERTGPLVAQLSQCLLYDCPELREALEGLKFQAMTCEYPTDRNLAPLAGGVAYSLFALATFSLLARFLSRWPYLKGAGLSWDDAIVLFCFIPVVGMTVAAIQEFNYGIGKDSWMLEIEEVVTFAKWFYIAIPLYIGATFTTKLSLIALYLRIWPAGPGNRYPVFRRLCWIMAGVLCTSAIACSLAMVFACDPLPNAWKYANTGNGTCINRVAAAYAYGGLNVTFDIIVIALPIPKLLQLDVSRKQKIGICSCFLVGFVATGCSIVRLFTIHSLLTAKNITWDFLPCGFWSIVEVYCSMICCCMPAMAGLINRCLGRVSGGTYNTSKKSRLPSFEMAHPPKRGVENRDLETRDFKPAIPTPRLADDLEDSWSIRPPTRKYTIKDGMVQQVTEVENGSSR